MKDNRYIKKLAQLFFLLSVVCGLWSVSACSKVIDIEIPNEPTQVVVEGNIDINSPPVVLLTKTSAFFGNVNTNIGAYFVRGAQVKVYASDGTSTELYEYCLQSLNLPQDQVDVILGAFGFSNVDSTEIPDVCVYTVPDIANFFLTGNCSFTGKERTTYTLDIVAPPFAGEGTDSIHVTSSTYIPSVIPMDSLVVRPHSNPAYQDSMAAVYAYITVPDTFGNFVRYMTRRNTEPFYKPSNGSVWDDKLFVGLSLGLPIERGLPPKEDYNFNTAGYFWKGDTVTVKWSNIDSRTFDFFYTLENDGGDSPFSAPVKIKSNINNGFGIWAGYASRYYTVIVPE